MLKISRRAAAVLASVGIAATAFAQPAVALPAPAPLSSSAGAAADSFLNDANKKFAELSSSRDKASRDNAWNLRNSLRKQADSLAVFGPQVPAQAKASIDKTVETFFPGLIAERTPKPAPAPAPAPAAAPVAEARPGFDYGSCPKDAKACVDINGRRSWLQKDGQVYYGAVFIGPGRPGYDTPKGTHYVNRKVKDEVSYIFNMAPMPYATYFTNNGIAFHEGDPNILSHGCIRMWSKDAQKYFNDLQIGDKVYVY